MFQSRKTGKKGGGVGLGEGNGECYSLISQLTCPPWHPHLSGIPVFYPLVLEHLAEGGDPDQYDTIPSVYLPEKFSVMTETKNRRIFTYLKRSPLVSEVPV